MSNNHARAKPSSLHRLKQNERLTLQVELKTLYPGDVFVKDGTAHMICGPVSDLIRDPSTPDDTVLIINLTNGSTWWCKDTTDVWPATEVKLSYQTLRRG